jgi:hypothetical protein
MAPERIGVRFSGSEPRREPLCPSAVFSITSGAGFVQPRRTSAMAKFSAAYTMEREEQVKWDTPQAPSFDHCLN